MLSGKQIAEARKRKGLTQEALAAELGVSRQTIAKWEQEISTPSVTNAHRLIDILGLQEMENKSSTEDEGNARTICKKRLTKRLLIELWAVYVGIAFLCFFSIGIVALFFIPAISVVLILVAIVVQEVRGKKTDSPMKILLGGICFIGLAILAVVAILASGFVLRENYQHKAFYSVPANFAHIASPVEGNNYITHFDASRSSSIYGSSTTVQPASVTVRRFIKAA